jgi:urease accessory protein
VTALPRLLQLASAALPIGGYSYSQGLETAIADGLVTDAASAGRWISDALEHAAARVEAPWIADFLPTWRALPDADIDGLIDEYMATRDTAELHDETLQMGRALIRVLAAWDGVAPALLEALQARERLPLPAAWAAAATSMDLDARSATLGWLWSWCENQVLVAVKSVPLGQTAGQRMLHRLGERLEPLATAAVALPREARINLLPGLAIVSSRHETQYTRIYRS